MDISVRDVAKLLGVSEKAVYRWLKQGTIPSYRIHNSYRFNRAELLEWATARQMKVSVELFNEPQPDSLPSLSEALKAGGIYYRIGGQDKQSVLRSVVEVMRLPDEVDKDFLLQVLLAREAMASTGIGDGIAIPHVRNPIVLHIPGPLVSLCFLDKPVDFGSLDGIPVNCLFTLVSPSTRAHLYLLSRLSFALQADSFRHPIKQQASRDEILETLMHLESGFAADEKKNASEGAHQR